MLPEGQDPDDLVRSGGASAIAEAIRAAAPLAELLFARETEGHAFDTPEKRAGLERRLRELVGQIADETLRRHYAADMARRLGDFFGAGAPAPAGSGRRERYPRGGGRFGRPDPGPRLGLAGAALPAAPRRLVARPREAPREIAILAILICHPGLLEKRVEEVAGLEFAQPRPRRLPRPAARPAWGGLRRGGAAGLGARGGRAGGRSRTHPVAGRRHGQLVVRRSWGGSLGRRTRFAPDCGLATEFGGVK